MHRLLAALGALWISLTGLVAAGTVSVASYNVENYLPMDRYEGGVKVEGAMKPESEIEAVVSIISSVKPDILGLIEMGDRGTLKDLQARLKAAGIDYPHSEWVEGSDEFRHVCLLSKFPIVARDSRDDVAFELDGKIHRVGRGFLDVTVAITPEYRLRLVGAHLKSKREVPDFDQAQFRAKEAGLLRQHIVGILSKDPATNLMVFGDFNDAKNEFPIREIMGTRGTPDYMMDLWTEDPRGERWTHFWKTADIYSRIDYLMVSQGLVPEVDLKKSRICDLPQWNEGSDHRLISTILSPVEQ